MFELPEYIILAGQLVRTVAGKRIARASLGNSPHKFVWYNRTPEEFASLTAGKTLGEARARGRWLFIPVEPGYMLVFGECGGRILFHLSASQLPARRHLDLVFADGSALSATTRMWGAMELHAAGRESERQYIRDMRPTPTDEAFSFNYLVKLIRECAGGAGRSVKGLLTQDQLIPGLGNSIAQDIMFAAGLHPKRPIGELDQGQVRRLYEAIRSVLQEAVERGGRNDECDLFGNPGGYRRIMDKDAAGRPCPRCGTAVEKVQYLGGSCYYCPRCQT